MTWSSIIAFLKALFALPRTQPVEDVVTPLPKSTPPPAPVIEPPTPSELLGRVALNSLGINFSRNTGVDKSLACAVTVSKVMQRAGITIPTIPSTTSLYLELRRRVGRDFEIVSTPEIGVIIVSPSAYGNGTLEHGHTGIYLNPIDIASNNSDSGLFEENYTTLSWYNRYGLIGKFPIVLFKRI